MLGADVLGDRPRSVEGQRAAGASDARAGGTTAVGEIDVGGVDGGVTALAVEPGTIESQCANRVRRIADLQAIGVVKIDHRRAA